MRLYKYHISTPFLVFTYTWLSISLYAQPQFRFRNYDTRDGLDANHVESMVQDGMGFIWTQYPGALSRFDGYGFKIFRHDPNNPSRKGMDFIPGLLLVDNIGNVWVREHHQQEGKEFIIARYDLQTDSFIRYSIDVGGAFIGRVVFNHDNTGIWLSTYGQGLFLYEIASGKIEHFIDNNPDLKKQSTRKWIRGMVDFGEYLLFGTENGLWRLDKKSGGFSRPPCDPHDSSFLYSHNIALTPLSNKKQLWLVAGDTLIHTDSTLELRWYEFPRGMLRNATEGVQDQEGRFWLDSDEGVIRYDPSSKTVTRITARPGLEDSLRADKGTIQLLLDREDNLWIGSNLGLSRLLKPTLTFYNYNLGSAYSMGLLKSRDVDYVLVGRSGLPHLKDRENEVSVARLSRAQPTLSEFKRLLSIQGDAIQDILQGGSYLWMSVVANGTPGEPGLVGLRYDSLSGKIETNRPRILYHEPGNNTKISSNSVVAIVEDGNGDLWLGQRNGGLDRVLSSVPYGSKGSVDHYPERSGHIFTNDPNSIWMDEHGQLELVRFSPGSSALTIDSRVSLKQQINFVYKGNDTTCYFSTWNALIVGNKKGRDYVLSSDPIWNRGEVAGMTVDDLGRLWLRLLEGVVCYDPRDKSATEFTAADGLLYTNDLNIGRIAKSSSGFIVVSGLRGISTFDPNSFRPTDTAVQPVLTQLEVNNSVVECNRIPDDAGFTTLSDISLLGGLELDYQHNNFTLEFSALEMRAPEKNRYSHKLDGYDPEWIQTDWRNRRATYTNLSPGTYLFHVKATNHDGVWSKAERTLNVIILPPPWRTWWAYTVYSLLVVGLLLLGRRNLVQREQLKANLKVAKLEQEKEHFELEKAKEVDRVKTSFFTNISHEFRTPLTLIKGPVQDVLEKYKDDSVVQGKLKLVQRNSDLLLKLINQLLDLAKLESGTLKVEKSDGEVYSFIRGVAGSFESLARQKGVDLKVDVPGEPCLARFDKDKVETILINLINNAIKFTPQGGKITVKATMGNLTAEAQRRRGQLTIVVSDSGIGIPPEHQSKIFERFHQVSEAHKEVGTGIGLALVKELVTLMEGEIGVKSEVGKGTQFTVSLPIEGIKEGEASEALFTGNQSSVISEGSLTDNGRPSEYAQVVDKETGIRPPITDHRLPITDHGLPITDDRPQVLVVEDNADLRAFIIDSLGPEFQFHQAENGKQGLEIATNEIPDMIISDVMMPEMDGMEMTAKLKGDIRTSHIPLILLTAKSGEDSKLEGLSKGADDYLTKPFNKQELLLKVRNGTARMQKLREKMKSDVLSSAPTEKVLSQDEQFLNKVKETIIERMSDEQLSVESLADDLGMSRVQLYRKVSALTGMAVNELIRKLRLQRAAQLLSQNWGPVSQVAYEVGFSNLSYFSKVFKEEFGVLPSEYVE